MRKAYWYFLFGLIILVFAVEYDLAKRTTRAVATSSKESTPGSKSTIATAKKIAEAQKNEQPKTFTEKFNEVSDEISQVQANPEKTEQKIQVLASTMSGSDLNKLSSVIVDKNLEGDQRAMAVELLSRHHSVEALKKLEDFIKNHDESGKWSREREFESVLRAQAVEGIATFPQKDLAISSLTSLDPRVSESFLKDRIRRSVASLKNQAPATDKQDDEALGKLIE